jgi:nucleoside-diphosphate kinase
MESTFVILKPDARQRGLVGKILEYFESAGLKIVEIQSVEPTPDVLDVHYEEHVGKDFYAGLVEYMMEGPGVIAVELRGDDAVRTARDVIGDTEPAAAANGTIRGDLGNDSYDQADAEGRGLRNLVHAAEDPDAAERELQLWF